MCGSGVGGEGRGTGVERDGGSMTVNTGTVGRGGAELGINVS